MRIPGRKWNRALQRYYEPVGQVATSQSASAGRQGESKMRLFTGCVLTAALAAPVPTAFSAQERQEPLVFGTQVELVAIPVFVKDKKGAPIRGLTAEDFEIRDEGKRMPIVAFHEIEIDAEGPRPRMPSRETAAVAQRQFLLLFDLSFSSPGGIVRSRSAAAEFLAEHLTPDDLAAVATYSANAGLKMLVGFTTDRQQLSRATESLGVLRRKVCRIRWAWPSSWVAPKPAWAAATWAPHSTARWRASSAP